jgi:hypothetical protein
MFKVPAGSVEEYFCFDPAREDALRELDAVIRAAAPALARWFVPGTPPGQPGMTMTMIGYGQYRYLIKSSPALVTWPVLGIALYRRRQSSGPRRDGDSHRGGPGIRSARSALSANLDHRPADLSHRK